MRFEILYALIVFCFVSAITPGPNNLMLLASGVNFGFQRTIPHMMGVDLGFALMVGLVGIGLDIVFARFPALLPAMRYAGAAYMLWLAVRLALAGPIGDAQQRGNPLSFLAAAAFQWINPRPGRSRSALSPPMRCPEITRARWPSWRSSSGW